MNPEKLQELKSMFLYEPDRLLALLVAEAPGFTPEYLSIAAFSLSSDEMKRVDQRLRDLFDIRVRYTSSSSSGEEGSQRHSSPATYPWTDTDYYSRD